MRINNRLPLDRLDPSASARTQRPRGNAASGPVRRPRRVGGASGFFCAVLILAFAGCASPPDEHIIPFNAQQTQALFARARPPQAFGLTVYNTDRGPVFAGAHRVHAGQVAQMPFLSSPDSRAPVIALTARGIKDIPALLDTASPANWIIPAQAQPMGIVALAGPNPYQANASHVYDEVGGYAGVMHKILLDKLHVENVVFYIRAATGPLGPPARWHQDPAPQAVLGVPFLRAFSFVTFDFANRSILFSATTPFPGASEDSLLARAPLLDIRGAIGVAGTILGEPTTFILDTGGDFELAQNAPADPTIRRIAVDDLVLSREVQVASAREIGLGDIEYPRIGLGLLSRYRVTFDFRNKQVIFERPR